MEQNAVRVGPINDLYYYLTGGEKAKATLALSNIDIYLSSDPDCKNPQEDGELYAKDVILNYDDSICWWRVLSLNNTIDKEVLEAIKEHASVLYATR